MSDTTRMFTILVKGPMKESFHFEDKLTAFVNGQKNNGLAIEMVTTDEKTTRYSQMRSLAVKAARWYWKNV